MGKIPVIHSAVVRLVWLHFETFPTNEQFVTLEIEAIRLCSPYLDTSNQYSFIPSQLLHMETQVVGKRRVYSLSRSKNRSHMIIINYGYQISYPYSIKKNLNSAQSPTTVGPASVSWARDLARATPVTLGWSAQQPPAAVTQLQRRHAPATVICIHVLMGQC